MGPRVSAPTQSRRALLARLTAVDLVELCNQLGHKKVLCGRVGVGGHEGRQLLQK